MTTINYSQLYAQAQESGDLRENLPVGNYNVEFKSHTLKQTQAGGQRANFRYVVIDGPKQGSSGFFSVNFPTSSWKGTAVAIFFETMAKLGITPQMLEQYGEDACLAQAHGQRWAVTVSERQHNGNTYTDTKLQSQLGDPGAASPNPNPVHVAPAPAPAPEPAPLPADNFPAPEPAPPAPAPEAEAAPPPAASAPPQAPGARPWG